MKGSKKENQPLEIIDSPWDDHLTFHDHAILERIQNHVNQEQGAGVYGCMKEYAHLRDRLIDLETVPLTDKQLIAVSLVFYGRVKKKRAAKAMNIASQSIDDHLKAALKKIQAGMV